MSNGNAKTGGTIPVTFSTADATFYEVENNWAPSQMVDGIFTGPGGGINGWAVYNYATGISEGADALLTLAEPLPAGRYILTFTIYQNYYGNPGHLLGDFALEYTTTVSPTLSSPQKPVSIQSASSLNGTTFSLLSAGELLANTSQNSIGTDTYTITAFVSSKFPITGIFLDTIKNSALPGDGPGEYSNGNFVVSEFTLQAAATHGNKAGAHLPKSSTPVAAATNELAGGNIHLPPQLPNIDTSLLIQHIASLGANPGSTALSFTSGESLPDTASSKAVLMVADPFHGRQLA